MFNENMFCPNCGNADQKELSYCRDCGEFLNDPNKPSRLNFGGNSPQQNVWVINFISLFAALLSLFAGIWMYATKFNVPIVLYFAAAILICNAGWHFSNLIVGMKLRRRLNQTKKEIPRTEKQFSAARTKELLPEADLSSVVSVSVTENTTKILSEDFKRKLS